MNDGNLLQAQLRKITLIPNIVDDYSREVDNPILFKEGTDKWSLQFLEWLDEYEIRIRKEYEDLKNQQYGSSISNV